VGGALPGLRSQSCFGGVGPKACPVRKLVSQISTKSGITTNINNYFLTGLAERSEAIAPKEAKFIKELLLSN